MANKIIDVKKLPKRCIKSPEKSIASMFLLMPLSDCVCTNCANFATCISKYTVNDCDGNTVGTMYADANGDIIGFSQMQK